MSLVIAVKENGRVVMGADSRTSVGRFLKEENVDSKTTSKISILPHGILIGRAGSVKAGQTLTARAEWVEALGDETLSKEFIVEKIMPNYRKALIDLGLGIDDDDNISRFIIAQKDKLFLIENNTVFEIKDSVAIGCGLPPFYVTRALHTELAAKELILSSLRLSSSYDVCVGPPYFFINTENLKYDLVED